MDGVYYIFESRLTELHPTKQGLKPHSINTAHALPTPYRATSNKTRIETKHTVLAITLGPPYRATSNKTRIETLPTLTGHQTTVLFLQSYIQQNKDWNKIVKTKSNAIILLTELHPTKQGLKPIIKCFYGPRFESYRATSNKTRIETKLSRHVPLIRRMNCQRLDSR